MKAYRWQAFAAIAALLLTALPASAQPAPSDRASTLKIAIPGRFDDPQNMNIYAPGVSRSNLGIHQVVYEYFFYNNLQTGEFIPWLAESYAYNDDFTTISVKLRDGVTWNDGMPFTADDVVFTYGLLRANPGMVWAEEANAAVRSVDKIDNLNVRINLKSPNPHFHLIREAFPAVGIWGGLTILPKHVWDGKDPLTFRSFPPVGTGPYKVKDASSTGITYERRGDWWGTRVFGAQPAPETVQFVYAGTPDNVALALAANDLDTPNIGILPLGTFLSVAQRNPDIRAWTNDAPYAWLDPCPRAMMVQHAHAPLDNPQVRWAMSYALDRNAIAGLAYEGATVPSWGIWPYYDANQVYFDAVSDLRAQYPTEAFDPGQATSLLASAGVDPTSMTLKYVVNGDSTEEVSVAAVLSDQLRNVGFNVDVQNLTGATLDNATRRGDYDIKVHSFCPGYIAENLELFHSKNYQPIGQLAPFFERNSFRYSNTELDAVIDQMLATAPSDVEANKALFHQAMAIWFKELPVVP